MPSFSYHTPTRIILGKGSFERVGREAAKLGSKALVVVGKSWARESGQLLRLLDLLKVERIKTSVFEGIEPNPKDTVINEVSNLMVKDGFDFVIALGGGSVMDAAKAIALVAYSGGEVWDYVYKGEKPKRAKGAFPVITVPSRPGSGSEADNVSVITKDGTTAKMPMAHPEMFPSVAIIDPDLATSLSKRELARGIVDMFTHVFEPYVVSDNDFSISDSIAESLMIEILHAGESLINGDDHSLREKLMWLSPLAMWPIHRVGRGAKFSMHYIEHIISGLTDCAHADGLSALLPPYMDYIFEMRKWRFKKLERILGVESILDFLKEWLQKLEMPMSLKDLGVKNEDLERLAYDTVKFYGWVDGKLQGPRPLDFEDILKILKNAMR